MGVSCALRCPCAIDVHVGNDVDECMAEGGSLEMRRDTCRSVKVCKRLRDDPAAKLVQMGADAAARTKRSRYKGAPLAARSR